MTARTPPEDPRGVIRDAYDMDLTPEECRSIFLDWVLGHPGETGFAEIQALIGQFGAEHPEHPMTSVLKEGLAKSRNRPRRRGGARGRRRR
jgi:hypothetical protein